MKWIQLFLRTVVILFLQIVIFNKLQLAGVCHPYVYVLLLICLPVMPRWTELLVGFGLGVMMDIICSSPGIHTAACVLVSWLRPILLEYYLQDAERVTGEVVAASVGNSVFVRLSLWLTVLHHLVVFSLDTWSLSQWYWVLLQVVVSAAISLLCILLYGFLLRRS